MDSIPLFEEWSNMIAFKNYINMSDEDKITDLVYDNIYLWDSYATINGIGIEVHSPDQLSSKQRNDFGKWLMKYAAHPHGGMIEFQDLPSWVFYTYLKDIKDSWVIHISDHADFIQKDGFRYGVRDVSRLGLTNMMGHYDKSDVGYNFAYTPIDADKYGRSKRGGLRYGGYNTAVIFKVDGVLVYHGSDDDNQVVFWGPDARHINKLIFDTDTDTWVLCGTHGERLVEKSKAVDIAKWLDDNHRKHKKILN